MKLWLSMLLILLPLGVMAAPAGNDSFSQGLQAQLGALPMTGSPAHQPLLQGLFPKDTKPVLLAAEGAADAPGKSEGSGEEEIDLREVDWDKIKADKKDKGGKTEVGNGEKEEENGDEENDDKAGGGEIDEGGGWDRLWDAAKSG
jgi:hypothetical protein